MSRGTERGIGIKVLVAIAVAIWVVGVVWSAGTWRLLAEESARVRGLASEVATMRALAVEAAGYAETQKRVQGVAATAPVALAGVVGERITGAKVDQTRARRQSLGDGWALHEQDLVFDEVGIIEVMGLVDELEAGQPPWRLEALEIRAAAHTPGVGQVSLTLAALQRDS